jgi:hypothetical protein
MGASTVVIGERGGASATEGVELGVAVVDPEDVSGLADLFVEAFAGRSVGIASCTQAFDYRLLASRVSMLLASVAGTDGQRGRSLDSTSLPREVIAASEDGR